MFPDLMRQFIVFEVSTILAITIPIPENQVTYFMTIMIEKLWVLFHVSFHLSTTLT